MRTADFLSASLFLVLAVAAGQPIAVAEGAEARDTVPSSRMTVAAAEPQRFQELNQIPRRRAVRRDEAVVPLPESDVRAQTPVGPPPRQPAPSAMPPDPTPSPSSARSGPPPVAEPMPDKLNMVRTAPEQIGQVPSQFMWIRDGLMAARGPLDGALVFFGDDGHVRGRAQLPNGFDIEDIIGLPTAIRLIDFSHRRQVTIQRDIDPARTKELVSTANGSDPVMLARRLTRRGPQELIINDDRQNRSHSLTIRSVTGGRLAQAYEISPGTNDDHYVVTEEIAAVKPALTVRVIVQRFDRNGRLTGAAYVPLDGFDVVPRNFIAISGQGQVRVLVPLANRIVVREIELSAPPRGRVSADHLKSLGRTLREIPVDANVQGDPSPTVPDDGPHLDLDIPSPPQIPRAKVLENARAYLTVNWVMRRENFSRPGIENRCDPVHSYVWQRPRRFTEAMIGATIGPMPYRWGGEDTPQSFRTRAEWGALAGSICTCRQAEYNYCIFADSAGVDCSGLVSRAWGIEKRGTSGLLDVANNVESLEALKPGDAFDWPQRHVRLFIGLAEGPAIAFNTIESSTRYQCEGVCERIYRPSEMNGYRLIRYKGIAENGAIASNGQNGGAKPTVSNGVAKPNGAAAALSQNGEATAAAVIGNEGATIAKRRTAKPYRRAVRSIHGTSRRARWR